MTLKEFISDSLELTEELLEMGDEWEYGKGKRDALMDVLTFIEAEEYKALKESS